MFLPVSKEDLKIKGTDSPDFVLVTGDAYVDHPAFAHAVISRVLEKEGYTLGIIAQPDFKSCEDFKRLGKPKLGFLVSAGNIDSMVAHYTVSKKVRSDDAYSPNGEGGHRPDRATIVYSGKIREAYGRNIPVIIGSLEASLRRFAHYDYWTDKVRRSILIDSGADLLVFGMGERQIKDIASRLKNGAKINEIKDIKGTAYIEDNIENLPQNAVIVPSFEEVSADKELYTQAFKLQYDEQDSFRGKTVAQPHRDKIIVQNPPAPPLSEKELDAVYSLPYERTYHPMYEEMGGVPAIREVEFSVVSSRGCFGGCNFCALTFHQGRVVTARSHKSIVNEAKKFVFNPNFKGYIHDVGGPTANFRKTACSKQLTHGACKDKQCLFPKPCENLDVSHDEYLKLLTELRELDGVKKVFVRSGLRFDYIMADKSNTFLMELCKHHISGQLKVAPEHVSANVLKHMGKPANSVYERFKAAYTDINRQIGKKQFLVPYLISSHPGSTLRDAVELAEYLRDTKYTPEQVQDFYPTPGTMSTCMYYTGLDPRTMEKVYVPKSYREKQMQRALMQYKNPKNYDLVYEALVKAKRQDLIGYGEKCLIRPKKWKGEYKNGENTGRQSGVKKSGGGTESRGGTSRTKRNNSRSGGNNRRK